MTEQSSKAALYRKIAAVAALVPIVKPTGYNPDVKKPYADVDDIAAALKPLLEERQLSITMHINQIQRTDTGQETKYGNRFILTTLECTFVIADGETGETAVFPWIAEASDHMKDKGLPKALTIARRTFLLHTFHVIAGDEKQLWTSAQYSDPEQEDRKPAKPAEKPAKPAEKPAAPPNGTPQPQTREDWATALKALWEEEKARGGTIPAAEIAIDLDDPAEAPVEKIKELGKKSKARIIELRKQPA